jgi:hypothetical protein
LRPTKLGVSIIISVLASLLLFSAIQNTHAATSSAELNVSAEPEKNPITRGSMQTIYIVATDDNEKPLKDASLSASVRYATGATIKKFSGKTDANGEWSFTWYIGENSKPGVYGVDVKATKTGYDNGYDNTFFKVLPKK